jgi:hypothetical protein
MSDNLELSNDELVRQALVVSGLGRSIANVDDATEADVRGIIRSGLRKARYPLFAGQSYHWRDMLRYHPISFTALYNTGTVSISGGTVTLTGGTFPTWAADGFMNVGGNIVFVTVRDSGTQVTISHTELSATDSEYTMYRYRYDLPADFSKWDGDVIYSNAQDYWSLSEADEGDLRLRYAINYVYNYRTSHYAITSAGSAPTDLKGTAKIMFWPIPQPDGFCQGSYVIDFEDNLPADLRVPGSEVIQCRAYVAEAFMEAVLSAAEEYNNDTEGVHSKKFQEALQTAIRHDKARNPGTDFSRDLRRIRGTRPLPTSIDFTNAVV